MSICVDCASTPNIYAPKKSFEAAVVQASSERSGTLRIKTAEGDTVTISFAALDAYEARSTVAATNKSSANGSSAEYGARSSASSLDIGIEVKGQLSDKELGQIGKLLERLTSAVREPGAGKPISTRGLGSLESFQFGYRESNLYRATSVDATA